MTSSTVDSKMKGTTKSLVRAALLALLMMIGCANWGTVRAQGQPASPAQVSSAASEGRSPGGQLAHESNEAAGEEKDEKAVFKESASVRMIARLTGLNLQQSYWLSVVLNFVVIAGVIIWAARKYLPGIFSDRSAAIQKAMQEAQKASEEARRRLAAAARRGWMEKSA